MTQPTLASGAAAEQIADVIEPAVDAAADVASGDEVADGALDFARSRSACKRRKKRRAQTNSAFGLSSTLHFATTISILLSYIEFFWQMLAAL